MGSLWYQSLTNAGVVLIVAPADVELCVLVLQLYVDEVYLKALHVASISHLSAQDSSSITPAKILICDPVNAMFSFLKYWFYAVFEKIAVCVAIQNFESYYVYMLFSKPLAHPAK